MPQKQKFNDNEKVYCYHGPLLYEAKVLKSRKDSKGGSGDWQYWVHYQGWNKNWDEWVPEERVLKINSESTALKNNKLAEQQQSSKEKKKSSKKDSSKSGGDSKGSSTPVGAGGSGGGGGGSRKQSESASTSRASTPVSERSAKSSSKKRELADDERSTSSRDDDDQAEGEQDSRTPQRKKPRRSSAASAAPSSSAAVVSSRRQRQEMAEAEEEDDLRPVKFQIVLPEELRVVLKSDYDLICKKSLFTLPAKITVASILADYVKQVEKGGGAKALFHEECVKSIREYFDEKLGKELLYRFERPQFVSARKAHPTRRPSEIYGGAHLVRLLARLDGYLNKTSIQKGSDVELVEAGLEGLVTFLETSSGKYFTSRNYFEADENYLKSASSS